MPVNLTSKTTTAFLTDSESITVTREVPAANPTHTTTTTIYSGVADFQDGTGSTYLNPQGAVEETDGEIFITAAPPPTVLVNDIVTRGTKMYRVVDVDTWTFAIPHVHCKLKRGGIGYRPVK